MSNVYMADMSDNVHAGGSELTLIGVHTDPDDVPEELEELDDAYNWAVSQGNMVSVTRSNNMVTNSAKIVTL